MSRSLNSLIYPFSPIITPTEAWFYDLAKNLCLLAPAIDLIKVQSALQKYLPQRVKRYLPRLANSTDASEWLKLIGKTGEIIQLWRSPSEPILVGINASNNLRLAQQHIEIVASPDFQAVREDLEIFYRWELVLPQFPKIVPSRDELLDFLYQQLERDMRCQIITLNLTPL